MGCVWIDVINIVGCRPRDGRWGSVRQRVCGHMSAESKEVSEKVWKSGSEATGQECRGSVDGREDRSWLQAGAGALHVPLHGAADEWRDDRPRPRAWPRFSAGVVSVIRFCIRRAACPGWPNGGQG